MTPDSTLAVTKTCPKDGVHSTSPHLEERSRLESDGNGTSFHDELFGIAGRRQAA